MKHIKLIKHTGNREFYSILHASSIDLRNKTHRKSGVLYGIAMGNQLLPTSWGTMDSFDASILLHNIALLSQRDKALDKEVSNLEGCALLTLMFWFGLNLEQSMQVCAEASSACCSDHHVYLPATHKWCVPAIQIPYKTKLEQNAIDAARPLTKTLVLNVSSLAYGVLDQWTTDCGNPLGASILKSSSQDLAHWLNKFIKNHNPYSRLTTGRISKYLFQMICNSKQGDAVDASFILGKTHFLAGTRVAYTARNIRHLNHIYTNTCDKITTGYLLETTGKKREHANTLFQNELFENSSDLFVGSRYCPKQTTVESLVKHLKDGVDVARKSGLTSMDSLLAFHQAYTLYTSQMIFYASGYRDVINPLCMEFEIDWETGFLFIHDKDQSYEYKPRVVWLPDICLKQIKAYQDHLNALMSRLVFMDKHIFNAKKKQFESMAMGDFFVSERGKAGSSRSNDRIKSGEWLPFLFFLTKVGWDQVRQKNVMAMIENFMPLPINASRHYIRSKLRETDCSKEVVRLVLGHWELGQEPFSNMSGLNPSHYREQLKQHWEPVFNTSGWKCQHGIS